LLDGSIEMLVTRPLMSVGPTDVHAQPFML
jgi:hypothetical protein